MHRLTPTGSPMENVYVYLLGDLYIVVLGMNCHCVLMIGTYEPSEIFVALDLNNFPKSLMLFVD